jgi:ubiquinone/menaquinone biosynthesis C-methylase UbiE
MLNRTYPNFLAKQVISDYVAPPLLIESSVESNKGFDTGEEYRLQPVFGKEIFNKLKRAGIGCTAIKEAEVLEVCAGTGFLTYHLLNLCAPKKLTVNDISSQELKSARKMILNKFPESNIEWKKGDMHVLDFGKKYDVIIGNSFLHHFHDVPKVLDRIYQLLNPGGVFISLHEPTPVGPFVEGRMWPFFFPASFMPNLMLNISRKRYKGKQGSEDIWLFEEKKIKKVALRTGFDRVYTYAWNLYRPIVVSEYKLHLSAQKKQLSSQEVLRLEKAIRMDELISRMLPSRMFGSLCIVCYK